MPQNPSRRPADEPVGKTVTPEAFLDAWQSSNSAQEVADKLGMDKPIVLARASYYRGLGINLKSMKRKAKKKLDIEELNRQIAKLNKKYGVEAEPVPLELPKGRRQLDIPVKNSSEVIKDLLISMGRGEKPSD